MLLDPTEIAVSPISPISGPLSHAARAAYHERSDGNIPLSLVGAGRENASRRLPLGPH